LIDEVGAFDGLERVGAGEALLFSVPMRATAAGTIEFAGSAADVLPQHNILLFDQDDPVPFDQVEFGSLAIVVADSGDTSGGTNTSTNPANAMDVNADDDVTPIDALLVINELNATGRPAAKATASRHFLDVSADGELSPLDALLVINYLNRQAAAERAAVASSGTTTSIDGDGETMAGITRESAALSGTEARPDSSARKSLDHPSAIDRIFHEWRLRDAYDWESASHFEEI
jgi:hypothetical protein